MRTNRSATVTRKTGETDITITLTLDGNQDIHVDTGIGFLDHMLHLLAKHGRFGLAVKSRRRYVRGCASYGRGYCIDLRASIDTGPW